MSIKKWIFLLRNSQGQVVFAFSTALDLDFSITIAIITLMLWGSPAEQFFGTHYRRSATVSLETYPLCSLRFKIII